VPLTALPDACTAASFQGLRGNSVTLSVSRFAERPLAEPRTDDDCPE
jgi:hypothetical protein